jgi:hypothetical protein
MPPVTVIDDWGNPHTLEGDALAAALDRGWVPEGADAAAARVGGKAVEDSYSGLGDKIDAYGAGVARGFTGGLSDAGLAAIGGEGTKRHLRSVRSANPLTSGAGEIVGGVTGAVTGVGPMGDAARLGARVAKAGEGAGALVRIGRAGAGAGIEGAAQGIGEGISELALSEEPIGVERAVSTLSSKAIYGGLIGAGAGTVAKTAEIGLLKGKAAIDDFVAKRDTVADVGDDLANMDIKGLQAVEKAEKETLEAARVVQRQELADELTAFRRELKQQKHAILTKDVKLAAEGEKLSTGEIGKLALKANRQLDNMLDNPISLAKNPARALDALQRQEHSLVKTLERADDLRVAYAADETGARAAALDTVGPALERNRALQAKITAVTGAVDSPKLQQVAQAKEALAAGGRGGKSLAEQMAGGTTFSAVTGAVSMIPGAGFFAPMIGAKVSDLITGKVFGRLGKAMSEGQIRSAKALSKVFETGARAVKNAPPLATRVLSQVAFAQQRDDDDLPATARLPQVFKKRSQELRESVSSGPDGKPVVKPHVRKQIADRLQPIAAFQPLLADRMETLAARRLEFLADKLPKRPDIGGIPIGPDHWQPSEMEMRTFARYVAAVEDPDGVFERVADGTITPEDAEVMREVYPEQLQDFTMQVLGRLPTLRQTLPYHRRLSLSILTNVPVDPSMDPRIVQALQAQFQAEPEPPTPTAQFGSVKNAEVGTPSQRREQGAM